jgi:glycosyltransferase involved in cell wall biosynthesis
VSETAGLGVVIIGRNEGERLRRCLASLGQQSALLVYVDSGSTDGSVALARDMGAHVVELDKERPFTAARARNTGLSRLRELAPSAELVQFVDGDCEVAAEWIEKAQAALAAHPKVAVVCGRRRERAPGASMYNRLCDIEWNTPIGPAEACGGDALMRVAALAEVGGYDGELIAGEEPDLCFRLRQRGFEILRIDAEMTLHDAAMHHFGQWWRRTIRSGHAYAEGYTRHRHEPGRYWAKEVRSNLVWGGVLPLVCLSLLVPAPPLGLLAAAAYPVLAVRVYRSTRRRGFAVGDAALFSMACVVGKLPSCLGQLRYWAKSALGQRSALIEYKSGG